MPLSVEKLSHVFTTGLSSEMRAVDDISFEIQDGEWIGIIGHTGSGKSTLVQHLNGLLLPTQGRVIVDELDITNKKDRQAIRKKVGMVFQYPEYQLFEETVEKDIAFGPKNMGIHDEEELTSCVKRAMEQVGLVYDEMAEKSPFELSGGQKRRVALAGILAMQPSILVLDEPMAGLDPSGRKEILGYLKKLHRDGLTIIMVSHSMDDMAEWTDRVLVMNEGKKVMFDTPNIVFSHEVELKKIGLDIPRVIQLANQLRQRGLPIPENIHRVGDLSNWIVEEYKRGKERE